MVVIAFVIPNTYSYAESLSEIKKSLQKDQIESKAPEQTNQNFNASESISKENIKNKALPKKQPIKKEALKKPSRITDVSRSPKRISETLPIKTFVVTPLPTDSELLSIDSSENKLVFIKKIKDMHNELVTQDYYYLKNYLDEILRYGNKYPDICALARLYYIEGEIKQLREPIYPDGPATSIAVSDLEKELLLQKMLEEIVATYAQGKKDVYKTCQYVVNKISDANGWLGILAQNSNKRKEVIILDIQKRLESIEYNKNELNEYETYNYIYYNKPSRYKIEGKCNDIKDSYNSIIHSYLILKNYSEAKKYFDELNTFYNSIKSEYTIHYKESYDSQDILNEKIQIKKDPNDYIKISVEYYENLFKSQNDSINYDEQKNKLKILSDYCDGVPHKTIIDNKTIEIEYEFNSTGLKNSAKFLYDKMALPLEVYNFYFEKFEKICSIYNGDVLNPEGTLVVKYITNRPITQSVIECDIESSVSNRSKKVFLKRSYLSDSDNTYYAAFIPNEAGNNNLINNEKNAFKKSVAFFRGDSNLRSPSKVYESAYFTKCLGRSDFEADVINNGMAFKNSISYLKSGGAEYVYAVKDNIKIPILIKNQADWISFLVHGNSNSGSVGERDLGKLSDVIIRPDKEYTYYDKKLKQYVIVPGLTRNDGTSEYDEDVDVIVIDGCGVLNNIDNVIKWHNVLPTGVILGYTQTIRPLLANRIDSYLGKFLDENKGKILSNEEVGEAWKNLNNKIYDEYMNLSFLEFAWGLGVSQNYSYLVGNKWYIKTSYMPTFIFRSSNLRIEADKTIIK